MLNQHRNKALLGLCFWLVSLAGFVSLVIVQRHLQGNPSLSASGLVGVLLVATFLIQFFVYLWGAYHLAKGRGQSESLTLLGLFCGIGQFLSLVVLLALPDKFPQRSHRSRSRSRKTELSGLARVIRARRNALLGI